MKLETTKELIDRYGSVLFASSYGEFDHLLALPDVIEKRSEAYHSAAGTPLFSQLETSGEPTIRDIWFYSAFLNWYLCWHEEQLSYKECDAQPKQPNDKGLFGPEFAELPTTNVETWRFDYFLGAID